MGATATTDISGNGKLLARIDERTKRMDEKLDTFCADAKDTHRDHEERLRKLERNTWVRDAGAALVGAVTGLFAGLSK